MSPLLYLLYTNDIDNICTPEVKIIQFTDHICIYTKSSSVNLNNSRLDETMLKFSKWLDKKNLTLEPTKSKIMIFTRRYKLPNISTIRLNNFNFEKVEKIKFLGIILESKLKWKDHIEYTINKCEKILNIMRSIAKAWSGAQSSNCLLIYNL